LWQSGPTLVVFIMPGAGFLRRAQQFIEHRIAEQGRRQPPDDAVAGHDVVAFVVIEEGQVVQPALAESRQALQFGIAGEIVGWLFQPFEGRRDQGAGLAAQFGLLMADLYGISNPEIVEGTGATARVLIEGYEVPDVVKFVFLGPLVGAGARVLFAPLTDRMGGAIWTLVSSLGLIVSIAVTIPALTPDTTSAATVPPPASRTPVTTLGARPAPDAHAARSSERGAVAWRRSARRSVRRNIVRQDGERGG
jgi:hypothetical protein